MPCLLTAEISEHSCMQEKAENIVYADVGPLFNNQSRSPGNSLDFDEHRVEYAQLNHKAQVSIPTATTEKSTNEGTVTC